MNNLQKVASQMRTRAWSFHIASTYPLQLLSVLPLKNFDVPSYYSLTELSNCPVPCRCFGSSDSNNQSGGIVKEQDDEFIDCKMQMVQEPKLQKDKLHESKLDEGKVQESKVNQTGSMEGEVQDSESQIGKEKDDGLKKISESVVKLEEELKKTQDTVPGINSKIRERDDRIAKEEDTEESKRPSHTQSDGNIATLSSNGSQESQISKAQKIKTLKEERLQLEKDLKINQEKLSKLKQALKIKRNWLQTLIHLLYRLYSNVPSFIVILGGSGLTLGATLYQLYLWHYYLKTFMNRHQQLTERKVLDANLQINGFHDPNKKRVQKFVCNPYWKIEAHLEQAQKTYRQNKNSWLPSYFNRKKSSQEHWIYFYGDPGIGKTSAFCAIVQGLNNKSTRKEFKKLFPFFKKYKKFICIHAAKQQFDKMPENQLQYIIQHLLWKRYFVIIDDAHLLEKSSNGRKLRDQISSYSDWIILLSSQERKDKDFRITFNLTELPHSEAIEQIVHCLRDEKNPLRGLTPRNQEDYLAYRMWYYTGGNMRSIKSEVLHEDACQHSKFYERAHQKVMKQQVRPYSDNKGDKVSKQLYFGQLFKTLIHERSIQLEEIVDLKFNFIVGNSQDDLRKFEDNNILLARDTTPERESFHSRRTQYAFSRWILDHYPEIVMKEGAPTREEFRQLLQKVEYKYILGFEAYSLKQTIKKTNPDFKDVEEEKAVKRSMKREDIIAAAIKEQNKQESKSNSNSTDQKKEEIIQSSPDEEIENESVDQSVIEIAKAEKEIFMKLYEEYQAQNQKNHSFEPEFTPKPIMRDLVKGEEHFKKVKGFDTSKVKQEEIAKIKEQIDKRMKKDGVAKRRADLYEDIANKFLKEFDGEKGFAIQKIITLKDFENKEAIDEKKFGDAKKKLMSYRFATDEWKQVIVCALELAVDSHNRMVQTAVKDSKEEKKGGQPNN